MLYMLCREESTSFTESRHSMPYFPGDGDSYAPREPGDHCRDAAHRHRHEYARIRGTGLIETRLPLRIPLIRLGHGSCNRGEDGSDHGPPRRARYTATSRTSGPALKKELTP
jgi:hypothetical protein